eukprot:4932014-Prymnesium_polylepis.1
MMCESSANPPRIRHGESLRESARIYPPRATHWPLRIPANPPANPRESPRIHECPRMPANARVLPANRRESLADRPRNPCESCANPPGSLQGV